MLPQPTKVLELREPFRRLSANTAHATTALAYAGNGDMVPVVVKACKPHEVAREVLCNVVARWLGIPTPMGFVVDIAATRWGRERIERGDCERHTFAGAWGGFDLRRAVPGSHESTQALLGWRHIHRAAAFDEWIGNADRTPANLVFVGKGRFLLIDHEQALPDYLQPDTKVTNGLTRILKLAPAVKSQSLRERLLDGCADFGQIDFERIEMAALAPAWAEGETFRECVRQLQERLPHLPALLDQEIGHGQSQLTI